MPPIYAHPGTMSNWILEGALPLEVGFNSAIPGWPCHATALSAA